MLASSLTATAVPGCTVEWDGGAGTDRWDDAANWQGDTLPAPSDTACISDTGLASVVVPSSFTAEVNYVVAGEALVVNGTLTLDGTADTSVVDSLTIAGGTVNVALGHPVDLRHARVGELRFAERCRHHDDRQRFDDHREPRCEAVRSTSARTDPTTRSRSPRARASTGPPAASSWREVPRIDERRHLHRQLGGRQSARPSLRLPRPCTDARQHRDRAEDRRLGHHVDQSAAGQRRHDLGVLGHARLERGRRPGDLDRSVQRHRDCSPSVRERFVRPRCRVLAGRRHDRERRDHQDRLRGRSSRRRERRPSRAAPWK